MPTTWMKKEFGKHHCKQFKKQTHTYVSSVINNNCWLLEGNINYFGQINIPKN